MLGDKIRTLRKENKISQEELAEKLGVSRQSISLWENGQTMPSMENIVAIADIFNVSTDSLLKDQDKESDILSSNNSEKSKKKPLLIISIVLGLVLVTAVSLFFLNKFDDQKLTPEEIFDLIAPSTVEIKAEGDTFVSTGTGCFIDANGTIVTNYHVIESCNTISIKTKNDIVYDVKQVLGFDKDRDLAIIKIDCKNNSFVKLKTGTVKTGEKVFTLGSSLGLTGTFSEGIISSASRKIDEFEFIQITAPISSGNSGGPLVNEYGEVIGITTGAFTEGQNLNLAIPASEINNISREKVYSINDFFQISKGKVIEQNKEPVVDKPVEEGNYTPIDIGYFDSLKDLEEAAQRNPDSFKLPVIVSVKGMIARTSENRIYLLDSQSAYIRWFLRNHEGETIAFSELSDKEAIEIFMIDDTKNRVITGDKIVVKGIYRSSAKTLSDCSYQLTD